MKKFNSLLNSGVAHLKFLKAKQLGHHTILIFEEYEYDAAILHVGINGLLRFDKNNSTLVLICDDIIDAVDILILEKHLFQAWHCVQKLIQIF